jgi:glycerophosphoryl diester phosphodiesterase
MAAFGAAIGLGADEIEFDLWPTKDGEIVSIHDRSLDRVSTVETMLKDLGSDIKQPEKPADILNRK